MLINFRLALVLLVSSQLLSACAVSNAAQNTLGDKDLREASGLATSRLQDDRLWLLNDGGDSAILYALDHQGKALARLKVRGQRNRDWEDMASFDWRGKHWLLAADIGDNGAKHKKSTLHFLEEPELPKKFKTLKLRPTFSVSFVYPDGPRDAESIAYDPLSEQLLILSKRDRPAQLYALSMPALLAAPDKKHSATLLGTLRWDGDAPKLSSLLHNPKRIATYGMATGFDISSDGLQAVILGYQQAALLRRSQGQSWLQAEISQLPPHRLKQAEAIGFSRDNQSIFITSEGKNSPLLQVPLP